jgi:hypothetical protein
LLDSNLAGRLDGCPVRPAQVSENSSSTILIELTVKCIGKSLSPLIRKQAQSGRL